MARNVELKCRCTSLESARSRALASGAQDAGILHQRDTFFHAPHARLKLREFGDGHAELISYRRPDQPEARMSHYTIAAVPDPEQLRRVLTDALGVTGSVIKRRHLLLWGATRIHLDEVEGLGTFVELETVMGEQSAEEAFAELRAVAEAIGLRDEERVARPYVELIGEQLATP